MYKIAAIGDFESIAYFGAIGVETFFIDSGTSLEKLIKKLAKNGYAVIFVTEEYYVENLFENEFLPAVILLRSGTEDTQNDRLGEFVRRAIGSDMIFDG